MWISKRCLSAEIETWLTTEMAVCARAMRSKLTKKINRADILGYVLKSLHAFTKAKFRSFIQAEEVAWEFGALPMKRKAERKGPKQEQYDVYDSIRAKTVKRRRSTLFNAFGEACG